ncbi:G5 domain-containing protein [Alicyclobacillus sp. SO9]|uniref:G5 domain-containing protein n=1 Tax=Alicyclobacillus sp. SO9 TaxID=2665646 RepID=UPI0018E7F813|nr:G5 domain-containing protein [Alicyclobacillus sp. SO9]QQE77010.1 G5 domain-containing protein [Alicyclobacillus sp. SO9]
MRTPKSKALYVFAAVFGLLGATGVTADAAYKTVTVQDNGHQRVLHGFTFGNVKDFLANKQIMYSHDAKVIPKPAVPVSDGMKIVIRQPKQITVDDGQHQTVYHTFVDTVGELFQRQGIQLSSLDKTNVQLDSKLVNGENIRIERIQKKVDVQHKQLPFQTVHQKTGNLYKGQTRVVTHGVKGTQEIKTTVTYVNGRKTGQTVDKTVTKQPVNEVIEVGTKARPIRHLASRGVNPLAANVVTMRVEVTAYSAGGHTATGAPAKPGEAAVDPSIIPLGSRITIPGYGTVVARDTGGGIVGHHIDICLATQAQARRWGIRYMTVYVKK